MRRFEVPQAGIDAAAGDVAHGDSGGVVVQGGVAAGGRSGQL